MEAPSMESYLTGRDPSSAPPKAQRPAKPIIAEGVKTALLVILLLAVTYLVYDSYQFQTKSRVELAKLSDQIQALENQNKADEAAFSSLKGELSQTQKAVGSTKAELKKTAQEIQAEGLRTKTEINQALSTKADTAQVQAVRHETEAKIGQVSSEVGGVKSEVGVVKTDLAGTKRDLENTQRQLVDVKDALSAAVARNAAELAALRRKGERDYYEFELPRKNLITKVEDIRLALTNTDPKKGKYNLRVYVDDNQLEKKDRTINEPLQFLVGRNRLRYEVVINWVQKDRAGGYLSIPKDKTLAAERPATK